LRTQFNVIDQSTGFKADLVIVKDRPFSRSEFARRVPTVMAGVATALSTREDTILAKLEWRRKGGSDRQLRDVAGMIDAARGRLDLDYLFSFADELGVTDELRRLLDEQRGGADPADGVG
jgi:hypothetical protein